MKFQYSKEDGPVSFLEALGAIVFTIMLTLILVGLGTLMLVGAVTIFGWR